MAVKTRGAEFKAFYHDDPYWNGLLKGETGDVWYEDLELKINGQVVDTDFDIESSLHDVDAVTIVGGVIYTLAQGKGLTGEGHSLIAVFKAWRKASNTAVLSVSVPKNRLEELRQAVHEAGGRIL